MIEKPPDTTSKLLAEADRLIHQQRPVVAEPPDLSVEEELNTTDSNLAHNLAPKDIIDLPWVETDNTHPADDLPILTDEVDDRPPALAKINMAQRLAVQSELTRWLEQELPDIILNITDRLADQVLGELTHKAEIDLLPRMLDALDHSLPTKKK